jgi:hypothetical protein
VNYLDAVGIVSLTAASLAVWWIVLGGCKTWAKRKTPFDTVERVIFTAALVIAILLTAWLVVLL